MLIYRQLILRQATVGLLWNTMMDLFWLYSESYADLPPIATGGRYDALTKHIGKGREIPAVGGVVRPDLIVKSKGLKPMIKLGVLRKDD